MDLVSLVFFAVIISLVVGYTIGFIAGFYCKKSEDRKKYGYS